MQFKLSLWSDKDSQVGFSSCLSFKFKWGTKVGIMYIWSGKRTYESWWFNLYLAVMDLKKKFALKISYCENKTKLKKNNDILAWNSKREPTLQGRKKIGQMSFGMCGMCGKCQTIIRTLMANQRRRQLGTALHARRLPAGRAAIVQH